MSEYYTVPDDVIGGTRIRSDKINEIIQATEDGFDALPTGLQDTQDEVVAARDGESSLLAQINDIQGDIDDLETEVHAARDGESDLITKINAIDTANDSVTSEVVAARDGESTLLAQINSLQADITLLGNAELPGQTSNTGKILKTNGTSAYWKDLFGVTSSLDASANVTLTSSSTQYQNLSFDDYGYHVTLPDATTLDENLVFSFTNPGDYTYGLRDDGGTLVATVDPLETIHIYLLNNSSSDGSWQTGTLNKLSMLRQDPVAFNSTNTDNLSCFNLNDSVIIVVYKNADSSNRTEVIAIEPSDGSVLDGPDILTTDTAGWITGCVLSSTEVFILIQDTSNNDLRGAVVKYTGGVLSNPGSLTQLDSNNPGTSLGCANLDGSNIGVTFSEGTNNDLRAIVVNWNGTDTISVIAGPTQIDTDNHYFLGCAEIDSTNWLCVAKVVSNGNLYSYSINWNGSTTISLNGSLGTVASARMTAESSPKIALLEDDGTYLFYGVATLNNEDSFLHAVTLNIVKITKSTGNIVNEYFQYQTGNTFYVQGYSYDPNIFVYNSRLYFVYNALYDSKELYLVSFHWRKNKLKKIGEQPLGIIPTSYFTLLKMASDQAFLVFSDDSTDYGSTMLMEIV